MTNSKSTKDAIDIVKISDLEMVFALKRMCRYLIDVGWHHQLEDDEVGAELQLAIARSKRYAKDVEALANLDSDLSWGTTKRKVGKSNYVITGGGDFNPWYSGKLSLQELLESLDLLVEFLDSISPPSIEDVEFIHFYKYLTSKLPSRFKAKDEAAVSITIGTLHPKILGASRSLFDTKHYSSAILEAYKVVFNEIKEVTGIHNLDGKKLVEKAFAIESPIISLTALKTESELDEQKGFMLLLAGAALGIRNPKAHDLVVQKDEKRALEYLSFASLLLTRIDERTGTDLNLLQKPAPDNKQDKIGRKYRATNSTELPYVYLSGSFGGNGIQLRLMACQTYNLSEQFIFLEQINILGRTIKFENTHIKSGESVQHSGIDDLEYPTSDKAQYLEIIFHGKNKQRFIARQKLKFQPRQDGKLNIVGLAEPLVESLVGNE